MWTLLLLTTAGALYWMFMHAMKTLTSCRTSGAIKHVLAFFFEILRTYRVGSAQWTWTLVYPRSQKGKVANDSEFKVYLGRSSKFKALPEYDENRFWLDKWKVRTGQLFPVFCWSLSTNVWTISVSKINYGSTCVSTSTITDCDWRGCCEKGKLLTCSMLRNRLLLNERWYGIIQLVMYFFLRRSHQSSLL